MWGKLVAGLALAGLLAGCDTITGGELQRPGEPTGVLELVNVGSTQIDAVVISECSAGSYGLNRLGSGEYIPVGARTEFVLSAGCWDVGAGTFGTSEGYKRITIYPNTVLELAVS